jgi:hypothetical protein
MWNQDNLTFTPEAARSALDRHAVNVAGYLLVAGIWLEHQARGIREKPWKSQKPPTKQMPAGLNLSLEPAWLTIDPCKSTRQLAQTNAIGWRRSRL